MAKALIYSEIQNDYRSCFDVQWRGQTFTTLNGFLVTKVVMMLSKFDICGDVVLSIRDVAGGLPVGGDLCSGLVHDADIPWSEGRVEFIMTVPFLLLPAQYAIVIRNTTGNIPSLKIHDIESGSVYAGGSVIASSDSGLTWIDVPASDEWFQVWGESPTAVLDEDFNDKNNGDLNGQGYPNPWIGDPMFQVQDVVAYEGEKSVQVHNPTGAGIIERLGRSQPAGIIGCVMRASASHAGEYTATFSIKESGSPNWFAVIGLDFGLTEGHIYSYAGGGSTDLGPWSPNVDYRCEIMFRSNPAHEVRFRVNGGLWTAWEPPANDWTVGIDKVRLYQSATGTFDVYYDLISEKDIGHILEDDFNSYPDGNLDGHGGWVDVNVDQWKVNPVQICGGVKSVRCGELGGDGYRIGNPTPVGRQTFYVLKTRSDVGDLAVNVNVQSTGALLEILFQDDGYIYYLDPITLGLVIITNYGANLTHCCEIEWTDTQARFRINKGIWTPWLIRGTPGDPDTVGIFSNGAGVGEYCYVDSIRKSPFPKEDFSKYTVVDGGGFLTVEPSKIAGADVPADSDHYAYLDKGANHFDSINIDFEINVVDEPLNPLGMGGIALSNILGAWNAQGNHPNPIILSQTRGGGVAWIRFWYGNFADDYWVGVCGITYYCRLIREPGNDGMDLFICSDPERTNVLGNLTIGALGTAKWRYIFGFMNDEIDDAGRLWNGFVQNLELKEETVGAPPPPPFVKITKAMAYAIRPYPYGKKASPYSKKVSPYKRFY
jgi:hypothetical protein